MRWIVGLGNPGSEYLASRHNIGFMVVDAAAARWNVRVASQEAGSLVGDGRFNGIDLRLVKPVRYMNRTGPVLKNFTAGWSENEFEAMIVIADDLALPVGAIRLRKKGGHGGHNGLRSIIDLLGHERFPRLRVGIGAIPVAQRGTDYVLEPFAVAERGLMMETVSRAVDALECWLENGIEQAMSRYNRS